MVSGTTRKYCNRRPLAGRRFGFLGVQKSGERKSATGLRFFGGMGGDDDGLSSCVWFGWVAAESQSFGAIGAAIGKNASEAMASTSRIERRSYGRKARVVLPYSGK